MYSYMAGWGLTWLTTLEDYVKLLKVYKNEQILGILLGIYTAKMSNYRVLGISIFILE